MEETNRPLGSLPEVEFPKLYSWPVIKKGLVLCSPLRRLVIAFTLLTCLMEIPLAFFPWGAPAFLLLWPCLCCEFFVRLAALGTEGVRARRRHLLTALWLAVGVSLTPLIFAALFVNTHQQGPQIAATLVFVPCACLLWLAAYFGQYFPLVCATEGKGLGPALKRSFQLTLPHWLELSVAYVVVWFLAYLSFLVVFVAIVAFAAIPMIVLKWEPKSIGGMVVFGTVVLTYIAACLEMSTWMLAFYVNSFNELRSRLAAQESSQAL